MTNGTIRIPEYVKEALSRLHKWGYEAYSVGGCVRDSLLGKEPSDWDIATSALPNQMKEVFHGCRTLETGLKHGTLTVFPQPDAPSVEITTFRVDGEYADHRHPERVTFTGNFREDLARRDFTINAMAQGENGLIDLFHGFSDLQNKVIRCVGEADRRFEEDGLRILRALRFAAVLDFTIEKETARAMERKRSLLQYIAPERIFSEWKKLLCGQNAVDVLRKYVGVVAEILPELTPMCGFEQHSVYHCYDVWEHSLHATEHTPSLFPLRMAALFHDAGKPYTFFRAADGTGHFYGHAKKSAEIAEELLIRLRADSVSREKVVFLVARHDLSLPPDEILLKKRLRRFGEENIRDLFVIQRADASALAEPGKKLKELDAAEAVFEKILEEEQCFSLRNMKITGNDLKAYISPGPEMGRLLSFLLDSVIEGTCENKKDALLCEAQRWFQKQKRYIGESSMEKSDGME